jgi:hypothetical protein
LGIQGRKPEIFNLAPYSQSSGSISRLEELPEGSALYGTRISGELVEELKEIIL